MEPDQILVEEEPDEAGGFVPTDDAETVDQTADRLLAKDEKAAP